MYKKDKKKREPNRARVFLILLIVRELDQRWLSNQ
jgi:hypothetical protein